MYNIEPFRGAVRQGDWKLVWRSLLPSKIELFNIADLFELDAGLSIDSDWQSLMALGAALRNDKVKV